MGKHIILAGIIAAILAGSILAAGCSDTGGETQPPASVVTMTTKQPAPAPETPEPPLTATWAPTPAPTTSPTPSGTTGPAPVSIVQDGSALLITGDVYGYKSPVATYIDEIRFTVVKAPKIDSVSLDTLYTSIVFTRSGMPSYTANYLLLSGDRNGDRMLDEDESVLLSIPLQPPNVIYTNQYFTMTIKTPPYQPVVVTARAPAALTTTPMVLAPASP